MFLWNIQKINIVKIVFRNPPKATTPSKPETKKLIKPVDFPICWVRPEVAFLNFHENSWKMVSQRVESSNRFETIETYILLIIDYKKSMERKHVLKPPQVPKPQPSLFQMHMRRALFLGSVLRHKISRHATNL